jgi:hypothetical protein
MAHVPDPRTAGPGPTDPRSEARAMFGRVLRSWAADLLDLRRRGLDRPSYRHGAWYIAGQVAPPASPTAEAA